jgi:hypothetical protein
MIHWYSTESSAALGRGDVIVVGGIPFGEFGSNPAETFW